MWDFWSDLGIPKLDAFKAARLSASGLLQCSQALAEARQSYLIRMGLAKATFNLVRPRHATESLRTTR